MVDKLRMPQMIELSEGFGRSNASRITLAFIDTLQAIIHSVTGLSFAQTEVLIWFMPYVAIAYLSMKRLAYKTFKNIESSQIAGLFYTANTYTLTLYSEAGHINILLAYAFAPLATLLLLNYLIKSNTTNYTKYLLVSSIGFAFDQRIALIIVFIQAIFIASYLVNNYKKISWRRVIINLGILAVGLLLINAYWIIPILTTPVNTLLGLSQNDPNWIYRLSYQTFSHGLFASHPFWSFEGIKYFTQQNVISVYYLFFILFGIIFTAKLKKSYKALLPVIIIWIIGAFLVKGTNAPFTGVYPWLYQHIPGFKMYREPQKFYVLVMFPVALMYAYVYKNIKIMIQNLISKRFKFDPTKYISILFFITFIFTPLLPAYLFKLGSISKSAQLPEYSVETQSLIEADTEFYRTLWLPQATSTAYHSDLHPRISGFESLEQYLDTTDLEEIYTFITSDNFNTFLDTSSIKYVILPHDSSVEKWYREDFYELEKELKQKDFLNTIIDEDYVVFENTGYSSLISAYSQNVITNFRPQDWGTISSLDSTSTIFANSHKQTSQIPNEVYANSLRYFSTFDPNQNYILKDNTLTQNIYLPQNDYLSTSHKNDKYYSFKFVNVKDNTYKLQLIPIDEKIKVVKTPIKEFGESIYITDEFILDSDNIYAVQLGNSIETFTVKEIQNGIVKGTVFIDETLPNSNVTIFTKSKTNEVHNDFEDEILPKVGNCRNTGTRTIEENGIKASIYTDTANANRALQIKADLEMGCISNTAIELPAVSLVSVNLSYNNIAGSSPKICLFDEINLKCLIETTLVNQTYNTWGSQTIYKLVDNSAKYKLYLYSDAAERKTINIYDNIAINSYIPTTTLSLSKIETTHTKSQDLSTFIPSNGESIALTSNTLKSITIPNSSFEAEDDYQLQVKDCNNFDSSTLKSNNIEATQVKIHTDGDNSLKISGDKHIACYSIPLGHIEAHFMYQLSLDYLSKDTSQTRICLYNKITNTCDIDERFESESEWTHKITTFIPKEKVEYDLYLYSSNTLKEETPYFSLFDNINIVQMPVDLQNKVHLTAGEGKQPKQPERTFKIISPTRYEIYIKNIESNIFLNTTLLFDESWQISELDEIKHTKEIDTQQYLSNNMFNGWHISTDKNELSLLLEYKPQQTFERSLSVTIIWLGLLSIAMYISLSLELIKRLKKGKSTKIYD